MDETHCVLCAVIVACVLISFVSKDTTLPLVVLTALATKILIDVQHEHQSANTALARQSGIRAARALVETNDDDAEHVAQSTVDDDRVGNNGNDASAQEDEKEEHDPFEEYSIKKKDAKHEAHVMRPDPKLNMTSKQHEAVLNVFYKELLEQERDDPYMIRKGEPTCRPRRPKRA